MPKIAVKSLSVHVRTNLLARGDFVTALPRSVTRLYADRFKLKILPIELPSRPWPVILLTLRNRTLTPVVERFIASIRDIAKLFADNRAPVRENDRARGVARSNVRVGKRKPA